MACNGTLQVEHNSARQELIWTWIATSEHAHNSRSRPISEDDLHAVLESFFQQWEGVMQSLRRNDLSDAHGRLEIARRDLTIRLVPKDLDLAQLAPDKSMLRVVVSPDRLPIECIDAGGRPLAVRYRLLHTKSAHQSRVYSHSLPTLLPRGYVAAMAMEGETHSRHARSIEHDLQILYGADGVDRALGRLVNLPCTAQWLCDPGLTCFYYFGHGTLDQGLCLTDGTMSGDYLTGLLKDKPRLAGSIGFLNCCWSATASSSGLMDPARALIESGWSTVIGTVLPPLDTVAAPFAEALFKGLFHTGCNFHRAYYDVIQEAWNQYSTDCSEPLAFGWTNYRIFGTDVEPYLRTPTVSASGGFGFGEWRIGQAEELHLLRSWEVVSGLITPGITDAQFFEALIREPILRPIARRAISVFVSQGTAPLTNGLSQSLAALLESVPVMVPNQAGGPCHLAAEQLDDAIVAFAQTPSPVSAHQSTRWRPVLVSDDGASIVQAFLLSVADRFGPKRTLARIGREKKLPRARAELLGAMTVQPDMAAMVRATWIAAARRRFAAKDSNDTQDVTGTYEADLIDVLTAALMQGIAEGLQESRLDSALQLSRAECDGLELVSELACFALAQAGRRRSEEMLRPLWWHVLVVLFQDFGETLTVLERDGLGVELLLEHPERLLRAREARRKLRTSVVTGAAVGTWPLRLPPQVLETWEDKIRETAGHLAAKKGQVVLALPWEPQPDVWLDALALELRARLNGEPVWRRRLWAHVRDGALVSLPPSKPAFHWRLSRKPASDRSVSILHEANEVGTLVISGGATSRLGHFDQWKDGASSVVRSISDNRIKMILAISLAEQEGLRNFCNQHGLPMVALQDLEWDLIHELITQFEWSQGRQMTGEALEVLRKAVVNERQLPMATALQVWSDACELAQGRSPTQKQIEDALLARWRIR